MIFRTLPFAILARHGFIAQSLARSLISKDIISTHEFNSFFSSIRTIAGELIEDADKILEGEITKNEFMRRYGHCDLEHMIFCLRDMIR